LDWSFFLVFSEFNRKAFSRMIATNTKKVNMCDQMVTERLRQRKPSALVLSDSEEEEQGTKRKATSSSPAKPKTKTVR
jgi:hypothetical protein